MKWDKNILWVLSFQNFLISKTCGVFFFIIMQLRKDASRDGLILILQEISG